MDMKGLKNKKMDARIECVGLEKMSKTIKKSDYKYVTPKHSLINEKFSNYTNIHRVCVF